MKKIIKNKNIESENVDKKIKVKETNVVSEIENTVKYIVKKLSEDNLHPDIRYESRQMIFTSKHCPDSNKPVTEFSYDMRDQKLTVKSLFKIGHDDKVFLLKVIPFFNNPKCTVLKKKDVIEMNFEIENPNKETSRKKITEILKSINDLFSEPVPKRPRKNKKSDVVVESEQ